MTNDTSLLRQVHPSFVQANSITSQVFRPTLKDEGKLSVYDGDLITPYDSWLHFTNGTRFQSAGVKCVTVAECSSEGLKAEPDTETFPEHAIINFNGLTEKQVEKKSKKLKDLAIKRGWLHRVDI